MNNNGEYLRHLRFADDIIIFANSIEELQEVLQELNHASLEVRLSSQGYVQRVR